MTELERNLAKKEQEIIAEIRKVTEEFSDNPRIALSYSGGKDSIVLWDTFKRAYRGDWSKVTVIFVDEEAIFDGVVEAAMQTRDEALKLGAKFDWYCMPFAHFSAISSLKDAGSYLLWQESEKENWIRDKPDFAVTSHPKFRLGMSYQEFFNKAVNDDYDLSIQGVRKAESAQRRQVIKGMKYARYGLSGAGTYYPIRELTEKEVFAYMQKYKLSFPIEYLYIHQIKGMNRKAISSTQLRMSQLFSSDTIGTLVYLKEFAPDLWQRVRKRQPNAYLASMYYGHTFHKDYAFVKDHDYFQETVEFLRDNQVTAGRMKQTLYICKKRGLDQDPKLQKLLHTYLKTAKYKGDPKKRKLRAVTTQLIAWYQQQRFN